MVATKHQRGSRLDAPRLYAASLTRQARLIAEALEALIPQAQRAGHHVSRTGEVTLYVAGSTTGLDDQLRRSPHVHIERVQWSRAQIEHASMERFESIPDELADGILADWFDPATNCLRVEVAPWWEGTAAQLARHLGVPVETTVFHGVEVVPLHVIEAPAR